MVLYVCKQCTKVCQTSSGLTQHFIQCHGSSGKKYEWKGKRSKRKTEQLLEHATQFEKHDDGTAQVSYLKKKQCFGTSNCHQRENPIMEDHDIYFNDLILDSDLEPVFEEEDDNTNYFDPKLRPFLPSHPPYRTSVGMQKSP